MKTLTKTKLILILVVLFLIIGAGYFYTLKTEKHTNFSVHKSTLTNIENLVTQKIKVADILNAEHKSTFGKSTASWLIEGSAVISVNLKEMSINEQKEANSLIITLPQPKISNFKIDHMTTKTYNVKKALLDNEETIQLIRNEALKKAEEALMYKISTMGYKENSKNEAEKILKKIFTKQGYTHISFIWE